MSCPTIEPFISQPLNRLLIECEGHPVSPLPRIQFGIAGRLELIPVVEQEAGFTLDKSPGCLSLVYNGDVGSCGFYVFKAREQYQFVFRVGSIPRKTVCSRWL